MKKNLEILEIEPKLDKNEKKFWRVKTNEDWMSVFNEARIDTLKGFVGKMACVEVEENKGKNFRGEDTIFKNITKCYGESQNTDELAEDEKPGVVNMAKYTGFDKPKNGKQEFRTPEQMIMCEMMHDAKDVVCALIESKAIGITWENMDEVWDKAIKGVKQAKEAFE